MIAETETLNPETEATSAAEILRGTVANLARFSAVNAEEMGRRRAEAHAKAVAGLRGNWGAPLRHVKRQATRAGEWAEWAAKLDALSARLSAPGGLMAALVGLRGNGKTQMAVELMRLGTAAHRSARFITAVGLFMKIKATFRRDATASEEDVLNEFRKPHLLVIDEFEKRSDSVWENNLVFELLNARYNDEKSSVLIANDSAAGFAEYAGASIARRINECGGVVECTWPGCR